jgi:hypothetical protein
MIFFNFFSETLSDLKKVKTKFGGLPSDTDLQGAAKALNRLQEIYRLNVTQFSRGNILGLQTGAELDVKDTFYLGRLGHFSNENDLQRNLLNVITVNVFIWSK